MIRASFPRPHSQVSSLPAEFTEMEPTRFCSVGGNRIKLYSNMRPNASTRCDQSANCSCAISGLPRATLDCQSCLKSPRCKSPMMAIHSPLPLLATHSEALGGFSPPVKLSGASNPAFCPPKSENHRATCRHQERKAITQWSAPTSGSQGKAKHTPIAIP